MALVESTMAPLGFNAPSFELVEPSTSRTLRLKDVARSKGLLVMFICNHCPYVKHIESGLFSLGLDYANSDIGIVAINANDTDAHPQDGPVYMAEKTYPFPYLFDETQLTAKSYGAECTPDLFLFNGDLECVYRGQFDDSRPGNNVAVTGEHVRAAMNALLSGRQVSPEQRASIGCNIKWR